VRDTEFQRVISYVSPYYEAKDSLHGLPHALRVLDAAREIARAEGFSELDDILVYGALFHGLAAQSPDRIAAYFGIAGDKLTDIVVAAAVASLGKTECRTPAEQILHDAHVIEGGGLLYYLKPLLTGTFMHQSMEETISFIDGMLAEVPRCYFEYSRSRFATYQEEATALHVRFKAEVTPSCDNGQSSDGPTG
jgi:uncharacterized protein